MLIQYEQRRFWEYPDAYIRNSPLLRANSIDEPLLIMHGANDNYPISGQSQDLYTAMVALGGDVRLVIFSDEVHSPWLHETQVRVLQEVSDWLELHLSSRIANP